MQKSGSERMSIVIALRDLYRCSVCKNVVEVVYAGSPALVCCGKPMDKLVEKLPENEGREKHVPVTEKTGKGVLVKVGSIPHPMTDEHHIAFIEVLTPDKVLRAELKPGMAPEALFDVPQKDIVTVREYCNIHGLWKNA